MNCFTEFFLSQDTRVFCNISKKVECREGDRYVVPWRTELSHVSGVQGLKRGPSPMCHLSASGFALLHRRWAAALSASRAGDGVGFRRCKEYCPLGSCDGSCKQWLDYGLCGSPGIKSPFEGDLTAGLDKDKTNVVIIDRWRGLLVLLSVWVCSRMSVCIVM